LKKAKLYKLGNTAVTIIVVLLCLYYLKSTYNSKLNSVDWISTWDTISANYGLFIIVVSLVPLNWGIEIVKWKWILNDVQSLSWLQSVKSVLCGVALSIVTPNGIGDFGGRMLGIESKNRGQALFCNGFLSFSQLLLTFVFGLLGLLVVKDQIHFPLRSLIIDLISWLLIGAGFWVYFQSKFRFKFVKSFLLKFNQHVSFELSFLDRLKILLLSLIRYLVFCTQFYLLLLCFKSDLGVAETFSSIAFVYLCSAIIPTGWFSSLVVRGSVSFFVFHSVLSIGEVGVVVSSLLWLINLLVPALIGFYFAKTLRLFPTINQQKT
jgi:hypothetical protein